MTVRQVGRCKICAWDKAKAFNKAVAQAGMNASQAQTWASQRGLTFDRKTYYTHRDHSQHPADALVSYADRAALQAAPTVTNTQFLEAIRDIGFQNAVDNPENVTLGHALKAVDTLERRRDQGQDLIAVLAKMMLGAKVEQVVTIEGQYQEV